MANCKVLLAILLLSFMPLSAAGFLHPGEQSGRELYARHCAVCHGVNLKGQPNWRRRGDDGRYPAPPHDETGHTWHHGDTMLVDYITRGGQAVLDDMGVAFTSGMPGFGSVLAEHEVEVILDYIKSTWPERIRQAQQERSQGMPVD